MRIAALYDIHGNLPALEAVVAEVDRAAVDAVVVGGDVLPGPMPRETLACLAALDVPVHYLRGNGDRVVCAERRGEDVGSEVPAAFRDVIRWSAAALADDEAARIERRGRRRCGCTCAASATSSSATAPRAATSRSSPGSPPRSACSRPSRAWTPRWSSAGTPTCRSTARCAASGS